MSEKQRLLEELQSLNRELDRPPEVADALNQDDFPSLVRFQDEFGSWYRALLEEGITPTEPPSYWSKANIEAALQALGDVPDNPPKTADLEESRIYPSRSAILDRFESWPVALDAAGYEVPLTPGQKWTEEQLLDDLVALGGSLERKPKATDVANDPDMASPRTYDVVFGSWNDALVAAGFSTTQARYSREYSDDELISTLQSVAADRHRRPKVADLQTRDDTPSAAVYRSRFGSWDAALAAAGIDLEFERAPQYTQQELLAALQTLAERVDRTPRVSDLNRFDNLPAPVTYYRRFESFRKALKLANIS